MNAALIGSFVEEVCKWDPRRESSGFITYVDLSSVDQVLKVITEPATIDGADAPSRARQLIRVGDVLVSTVRPNLNAVAQVPSALDGATASTGFCVLRPKRDAIDGRYLFHWVRTKSFIGKMVQMATGASYPAVSDKIIKASEIPFPPLDDQRVIARLLDTADNLRARRRDAVAKLDILEQAMFLEQFGDPGEARLPLVPIGELVRTPITRGIDQPGPEYEGGVPYIKTTDFGKVGLARADLSRSAPEIAARFPRSVIETGDVIICIRATVGPSLLVTDELAGANLSRGTARISPSREVLPEYLFAAVNTNHFQRQIISCLRGATFLQIPLRELRQLVVPLPSIREQRDFASRWLLVRRQLELTRRHSAQIDTLFSSIQQRAFEGSLL